MWLGGACVQIDLEAVFGKDRDGETPEWKIMTWIGDAKSADTRLKKGTIGDRPLTDAERKSYESQRSECMTNLAEILQKLGERTRDLASRKSSRAGPAAEFSMLAVEATREALGMEHRGTGKFGPREIEERKKAGRQAAQRVRELEEKEKEKERL